MHLRVYKKKHNYSGIGKFFIFLFLSGLTFGVFAILDAIDTCNITTEPITTSTTTALVDYDALLLGTIDKMSELNVFIQVDMETESEIGSGTILYDDDLYYYAITCEHVIDANNQEIIHKSVRTHDGFTSDFEIIKVDEEKDLALIRFTKENRVEIYSSYTRKYLVKQEMIISIGNPSGLSGTISIGTISKTNTTLQELEITRNAIEHDARVYPGSSGGALVDMNGYLIGINAWELNGKSYAIPYSDIQIFLDQNEN